MDNNQLRMKVLQGLICCHIDYNNEVVNCDNCPYQATEEEQKHLDWSCHYDDLKRDAIFLLKEDEEIIARLSHTAKE